MDDFTLRFRHPSALLVAVVACWVGGEFVAPAESKTQFALYGMSMLCLLLALALFRELLAVSRANREIAKQEADRYDLEAAARYAASVSDLPPDGKLQAMAVMFPGYGYETIHIAPQVIIQDNSGGAVSQYEWPSGLATGDQWRKLAVDYFDKTGALPIDYLTENGINKNKIFGRRQLEKILAALVENGLADKDPLSQSTTLRPAGETALRQFYKPDTATPTSPSGFHPLNLPA